MKYFKKTLSFVLSLAMVFTMVIVPRTGVANAADDSTGTADTSDTTTSDYTYFDTTMFKYNTDTFNAATKALEGSAPTKISSTAINTSSDEMKDVLIVVEGYALKDNNGTLEAVSFDSIKDSSPVDESLLWTITSGSNIRSIKNKATRNYLNMSDGSVSVSSTDQNNLYVKDNSIYYKEQFIFWSNNYYLKFDTSSNKFIASTGSSNISIYKVQIDQTKIDQGIYFNDGGSTTTISNEDITNEDYNKWTGSNKTAYTGLVASELDENSKIVFNHPQAGIFDTSTNVGKSYYTNVEMPFKTDGDYYYYDSNEYDVKFPNNTPVSNTKLVPSGISYINNDGNKTSFLPFASGNQYSIGYSGGKLTSIKDSNNNDVNISDIYHFGMNMSVKFYMTNDGLIDKDSSKPMKFEFSGDDDVWVFIDGKLVLDIGGIHDRISADINFATGTANVYKGDDTSSDPVRTSNIYTDVFETDATTWRKDEDQVHTLQVFYLERGAGESNCKIKFNLMQKDRLEVTKSLGNKDTNDADLKALLTQKFEFEISSSTDGTNYSNYANKEYYIYESGNYKGIGVTDNSGRFKLGFNQTALFKGKDLSKGYYYRVKEIVPNDAAYTSDWKTSKTFDGKTTNSSLDVNNPMDAVIKTENNNNKSKIGNYKFTFTNTFNPTLNDDVVVLDYGKQAKIDVLANDILFGADRKIDSINPNCQNGELTLSDNNTMLTYRPFKYMSSIDTATYTVKNENNTDSKTANVSIMPASTVYYEDNFGGKGTTDGEPGLAIEYSGDWVTVKDDTTIGQKENSNSADLSNGQQITSANTSTDYQDDGTVGQGNRYGYDKSYEGDGKFSDGSSAVVNGTYNSSTDTYNATAKFNFTGTGFDIISRTDKNCGTIYVTVKDTQGNILVKQKDGTYTKSTDPDEKTISVINKGTNDLYQIPVISLTGLPHGDYNVKIEVCGESEILGTGATFYLDAIRIYDPIKQNDSTNTSTQIKEAYSEDNEANTQVKLVKDIIVKDNKINGKAFIDTLAEGGSGSTDSSPTYDNLGPNNEVYIDEGQGITFTINTGTVRPVGVYLGAKSPNGKESILSVGTVGTSQKGSRTITSATDMYYNITDYVKFTKNDAGEYTATLVIGNKQQSTTDETLKGLLSLTNIKFAYTDEVTTTQSELYSINEDNTEAVAFAKTMLCMAKPEQPETEKANLEISSAEFTSSKVSILKPATLVVKTSPDVKYLGILDSNGKVIEPTSTTSKVDESLVGTKNDSVAKTWTVKIKFSELGTNKVAVYGIGENGDASEDVKETSVKVNLLGSIKDLFTEWW